VYQNTRYHVTVPTAGATTQFFRLRLSE
jgi:hypothetical protein